MKRTPTQNNSNIEQWSDIPGYEGYYSVSSFGQVKSQSRYKAGRNWKCPDGYVYKTKEKLLKKTILNTGYEQVNLYINGNCNKVSVHRLVAELFIENPNNYPQVNHIDGNKRNNNIINLEWCTQSMNTKHAYDVLNMTPPQLGKFGEHHGKSKAVIQKDKEGNIIKRWGAAMDAVRNGFDSSCISRCCSGESETHKGYTWEYE